MPGQESGCFADVSGLAWRSGWSIEGFCDHGSLQCSALRFSQVWSLQFPMHDHAVWNVFSSLQLAMSWSWPAFDDLFAGHRLAITWHVCVRKSHLNIQLFINSLSRFENTNRGECCEIRAFIKFLINCPDLIPTWSDMHPIWCAYLLRYGGMRHKKK